MATIVLAAVGASLGASIGGGVLGLSSVVIGRAVGAMAGSMIDQAVIGGGSDVVEQGKIDRFRLVGASEGAPIARVYGRMRMGGQVIWGSKVTEHVSTGDGGEGGSGKGAVTGGARSPQEYSYTMSLAIALCEGEITRVGRVWADGEEIAPERLNMRVYTGSETQMPDPKIEAVKGAGNAPAFRGIAYVVLEELDLTAFGNRVPVLNFEVFRPEQPDEAAEIARGTRAVAIIPGTGEYTLATSRVHAGSDPGEKRPLNENTPLGKTDFAASLEMIDEAMPSLEAASLVVSWFGDDLRCDRCSIRPLVEHNDDDGHEMPWRVSGQGRSTAGLVPLKDDNPVYGGTPTDQSVVEAITAIREAGKAVTFYPFILMTQMAGNGLVDPWTGESGQPALPWRGRITTSRAPGVAGSPDRTSAAADEVAGFFGTVARGDFSISGTDVGYHGPDEWSYRRFILHYAHLCKAAGGVDAFLIGSELRGLTQIRSARAVFPAVAELRRLAGDVRAILGPQTKISYAADWTEYFGYQPQDGSGDLLYHLDALWMDDAIDFVGIDNYMPLSDWRDGLDHADAAWGSIYDLGYLKANILGGEGYDWYYRTEAAEKLQLRSPITDGAYGKPWVYRYKDIVNWWRNPHVPRIDGIELTDLPLTAPMPFDGNFDGGDVYWMDGFEQDEAALATAPGLIETNSDAIVVHVPGEGNLIEVADTHRIMSERGWRPFVEGQEVSVTIRTRLLSPPADGNPHRTSVWIAAIGADGGYSGYASVSNMVGLSIADGWVDLNVVFNPHALLGTGSIAADAKGWRLVVGFNGPTPDDPAGAVQQVSRVTVASTSADSGWVPGAKPVWFTEIGCAAIDKGTNQPNRFLDPKSSESGLPKYSSGRRDDFIQMRYLRALNEFWSDPANNPTDAETGVQMLDMARAHVWAWDARPFPWFPGRRALWADGANYSRGHWLNGRESSRSLASVVSEICTRSGVAAHDVSRLDGVVRGYAISNITGARNALQPLMLAHGFEATEREGVLEFFTRTGHVAGALNAGGLALSDEIDGTVELARAPVAEVAGRIRLNFIGAQGGYEARATETVFPDEATHSVSQSELPMVLTGAEGRAITERWLAEARVARDTARFALPNSGLRWRAGDVVRLDLPAGSGDFRIDHLEQGVGALARAVRVEPGMFRPAEAVELDGELPEYTPPVPVLPLFLDLPLLTGEEVAHAPQLAVTARPWPGPVAVYRGQNDAGYSLIHRAGVAARVGVTQTVLARARPGVIDRGPALRVRMTSGELASAELPRVLSGANAAVIGDGTPGGWEVFQFTTAELVGDGIWELSGRLRGQAGSDATMPEAWPVGSYVVMLDGAVGQIPHPSSLRGLERDFRIGPATRSYDDDTYVHAAHAFDGIGLRPLAPVHLTARWAGGDLAVSWIRRTRIGGDSWLSEEVPLGEESERYLVRVLGGLTLLREADVSAPGWTYTAQMRAADGVTGSFAIEVAQVSASFGAGPYRRIALAG